MSLGITSPDPFPSFTGREAEIQGPKKLQYHSAGASTRTSDFLSYGILRFLTEKSSLVQEEIQARYLDHTPSYQNSDWLTSGN